MGGGTRNANLLLPLVASFPTTLAWMGLLAGVAGPRFTDSKWLPLLKGIERQLRHPLAPEGPAEGDLSWMEYTWIRDAYRDFTSTNSMVRMFHNIITTEVFPGCISQVRLSSTFADDDSSKAVPTEAITLKASELDAMMITIQQIAERVRNATTPNTVSHSDQLTMDLSEEKAGWIPYTQKRKRKSK